MGFTLLYPHCRSQFQKVPNCSTWWKAYPDAGLQIILAWAEDVNHLATIYFIYTIEVIYSTYITRPLIKCFYKLDIVDIIKEPHNSPFKITIHGLCIQFIWYMTWQVETRWQLTVYRTTKSQVPSKILHSSFLSL